MAVEAIINPQKAYQGSVPKKDAPRKSERKTVNPKVAEAPPTKVREKAALDDAQDMEDIADTRRAASVTDAVKNAEGNPGMEALRKAIEEINRNAKNSEVVFGMHDATNRVTIKIVDKESKEVLKEYPPEKTLDMIAKVWEIAGLMVDAKG